MKIIFLDMDGVVNCGDYFDKGGITQSQQGAAGMIDPHAVHLLNRIIQATGALVVSSSSWRCQYPLPVIQSALVQRGFEGFIIGATPATTTSLTDYSGRGDEIKAWLDVVGDAVESYVVLDDLGADEMRAVRSNHVETGWHHGLCERHVRKAIEILNDQ
jgi:hypothetical protein